MGVTGAQPLRTGELRRSIAVIKARYCLGNNPAAHLNVCSYQAVILHGSRPRETPAAAWYTTALLRGVAFQPLGAEQQRPNLWR